MMIKASIATAVVSVAAVALPAVASADASDDYPIPNRILKTPAPSISTWPRCGTSSRSTTSAT